MAPESLECPEWPEAKQIKNKNRTEGEKGPTTTPSMSDTGNAPNGASASASASAKEGSVHEGDE